MGVFTLDVSTLSGTNVTYQETPLQERGQTIQMEWVQSGANQDIRLHGYACEEFLGNYGDRLPSPKRGQYKLFLVWPRAVWGRTVRGRSNCQAQDCSF